jgi:hypothetical protein
LCGRIFVLEIFIEAIVNMFLLSGLIQRRRALCAVGGDGTLAIVGLRGLIVVVDV